MLEERLVSNGSFNTSAAAIGSAAATALATVFAIVLSAAIAASCHLFWCDLPPPH
jgi:hypothetical protein